MKIYSEYNGGLLTGSYIFYMCLVKRFYDPATSRMLSEDSYRGDPRDPLSLNLYTYCRNNPLVRYDPTGHADIAVRASNESQGNTVDWKKGNTAGNSTITITTANGAKATLKEGVDYYIGKDGSAYYKNQSSNAVRSTNESQGKSITYVAGSTAGGSKIIIGGSTVMSRTTAIYEGKDYYIGNDGKAYYYGNVRTVSEAYGSTVAFKTGTKGSSTITITRKSSTTGMQASSFTLIEGKSYYIGSDGRAHYFNAPPSMGPTRVKKRSDVIASPSSPSVTSQVGRPGFDGAGGMPLPGLGINWDYIGRSVNQIIMGNFTDDVTILGTLGQIGLGFSGVDIVGDLRDVWHDIENWEWSWDHFGKTLLDAVGVIPLIGSIKNIDEVGALFKGADRLDDVADAVKGAGRVFNNGELFETSINLANGASVTAIAETVIDGKTLTLKDIVIYSNVGDIPNEVGYSQLRGALDVIGQQAKNEGFETLRITGQRAANSTSANPGKLIDMTIDLLK